MKKILALAAVAALTAGVSAYAANPFADVSADHWAYQAVADLSAQGVVEGYPDGTFGGEKNITRYEVAQIVARLMAQEAQLNAQQKAVVDKLAAEYADELNNLGVRVSNIENKIGNITWGGDARVKFEREDNTELKKNADADKKAAKEAADAAKKKLDEATVAANGKGDETPEGRAKKAAEEAKKVADKAKTEADAAAEKAAKKAKHDDTYSARIRLNLKAQANDKVAVKARLATKFNFVDEAKNDLTVKVERLHAEYAPIDGFVLDLGRTDATLGGGLFYDSIFDGVVASYNMDKFNVQAGYGRYRDGDLIDEIKEREAIFVQGSTKIADKVDLGAFYTRFEKRTGEADAVAFYGVNAKADLIAGLSVDGEYVKGDVKVNDKKPAMWNAGLGYKFGPAALGVHYYDVEAGSNLNAGSTAAYFYDNAKFWIADGAVEVAKDVTLKAEYLFKAEKKDVKQDLDNKWNVSLNYVF